LASRVLSISQVRCRNTFSWKLAARSRSGTFLHVSCNSAPENSRYLSLNKGTSASQQFPRNTLTSEQNNIYCQQIIYIRTRNRTALSPLSSNQPLSKLLSTITLIITQYITQLDLQPAIPETDLPPPQAHVPVTLIPSQSLQHSSTKIKVTDVLQDFVFLGAVGVIQRSDRGIEFGNRVRLHNGY